MFRTFHRINTIIGVSDIFLQSQVTVQRVRRRIRLRSRTPYCRLASQAISRSYETKGITEFLLGIALYRSLTRLLPRGRDNVGHVTFVFQRSKQGKSQVNCCRYSRPSRTTSLLRQPARS